MYLQVGADVSIPIDRIVAILDARALSKEPVTRAYLERLRGRQALRDVCDGEVQSYIVTDTLVYACSLTTATLRRRTHESGWAGLFDNEKW